MRKDRSFLAVAAGLMLWPAAVANAGDPGASPTPPPEDVTVTARRLERDKRVCVSDVTTGHIMPRRVCKSKGEWDDERQRALVAVQRLKDDRTREQHVRASVENAP